MLLKYVSFHGICSQGNVKQKQYELKKKKKNTTLSVALIFIFKSAIGYKT